MREDRGGGWGRRWQGSEGGVQAGSMVGELSGVLNNDFCCEIGPLYDEVDPYGGLCDALKAYMYSRDNITPSTEI